MFKLNPRYLAVFSMLLGLLFCTQSNADAFDDFASNVFKFQLKLANNGQVQAQYKLGRMYETGRGTEKSVDEALRWYTSAADKGFEPAADRITFYEVKQLGYKADQYGDWVDSMVTKAKARIPESMELLSQMYIEGVGVRKNDRSALRLLILLSMEGNSEVDADIAALESKLARANKPKKKKAAAKVVLKSAPESPSNSAAGTTIAKASQPATASATQDIAGKIEQELIAKKRRYDAVMKQLQEEQRMLDEQQQWAEAEQ